MTSGEYREGAPFGGDWYNVGEPHDSTVYPMTNRILALLFIATAGSGVTPRSPPPWGVSIGDPCPPPGFTSRSGRWFRYVDDVLTGVVCSMDDKVSMVVGLTDDTTILADVRAWLGTPWKRLPDDAGRSTYGWSVDTGSIVLRCDSERCSWTWSDELTLSRIEERLRIRM